MNGLSKCQYRSCKVGSYIHHVSHGAGVGSSDEGDRHEPGDEDQSHVAAQVANEDHEEGWDHLGNGCEQLPNVGQTHDVPHEELIGGIAEEHGGEIAAQEGGASEEAVRLYAEPQDGLHVARARNDEDVVHPDTAECGDANGPRRRGGQNGHPWHFETLGSHNGRLNVLLNVVQLLPRDARVFQWCVERQEPPSHTPDGSQGAGGVEYGTPAVVGYEEPTQGVGETYSEAETLEGGHESTSLIGWDPVPHQSIHSGPGQPGSDSLDGAKCDQGAVMQDCRLGNEEGADGGDELREAENRLGAKALGEHAPHHLGQDVAPVEGAEDSSLGGGVPVKLPLLVRFLHKRLVEVERRVRRRDAGVPHRRIAIRLTRVAAAAVAALEPHHGNHCYVDVSPHHEAD